LALLASGGCRDGVRGLYPPVAAEGRLIALGGAEAAPARACFSCHGLQGQGDGAATPRLAGLDAVYLEKQLLDYAEQRRPDPVMTPIARALSPRERRNVARHYAAAPSPPFVAVPAVSQATLRLGERLYLAGAPERGLPACATCHGGAAEGGGPGFPPLSGQPSTFVAEQLRRWRLGERRNDPRGLMSAQAVRLSQAEIDALAAYVAHLGPARADRGA
jgi:cytochrome c553